jgi:hypothetical protein
MYPRLPGPRRAGWLLFLLGGLPGGVICFLQGLYSRMDAGFDRCL